MLPADASGAPPGGEEPDAWTRRRERMVREQIEARGVSDARVLGALRGVPRHLFVPEAVRGVAYEDRALPIDHGQTISQPYMVAVMTELVRPAARDRVLEVGTGSGYQAAVLAGLVREVYSIERIPELAADARQRLAALGYGNVQVITGDGYRGLPAHAPFDAIVVTAAPPEVPPALVEQLAVGGRLVIPVGERSQLLRLVERTAEGLEEQRLFPVAFVPMVPEEGGTKPPP